MNPFTIGTLQAETLGPSLGIFIKDLDPNKPLTEEQVKDLTEAVNEHHLVLLKSSESIIPETPHRTDQNTWEKPGPTDILKGNTKNIPRFSRFLTSEGKDLLMLDKLGIRMDPFTIKPCTSAFLLSRSFLVMEPVLFFTSLLKALDRMPPEMLEKTKAY